LFRHSGEFVLNGKCELDARKQNKARGERERKRGMRERG
jgi:hypothetical protein